MKKGPLINTFFFAILFALFLWQSLMATLKYMEFATIMSTSSSDEGSILFPSISVCKKYSFNTYAALSIKNTSMSLSEKIILLQKYLWTRNETFYFANHPGMFNASFPCTTQDDIGTDPGKPCSFPYIETSLTTEAQDQCSATNDCFTRLIQYTRCLKKQGSLLNDHHKSFRSHKTLKGVMDISTRIPVLLETLYIFNCDGC